jgi:hypothetical protein
MTATTSASITFSPAVTAINVGEFAVLNTKDTTIKIYNRTQTNYTLSSLALVTGSPFTIQTNTASQPLNAGDSISIVVRFAPTTGGLFRDTMLISNNIPIGVLTPNPYRIAFSGLATTNAVIDPNDYVTIDNASGIEGFAIQSPDSAYFETSITGFWQNASGLGGTHRRSPNLSGSGNGSNARYTFKLDSSGTYVVYHHLVNSSNSATNSYVHFRKFGLGSIFDSLRYNQQDGNATGFAQTWFPLGAHHYDGVGAEAASVTIGSDALSAGFLRVDAVRLLRSRLPRDLEFGRRDGGFGPVRVPEEAPQITVGDEFVRNYRLYNIGTDTLKITNVQLFPTSTPVAWFYFKNYTAGGVINIPPLVSVGGVESGGYYDLQLAFSPFQEGSARDSMVITSNDAQESNAYIVMTGVGINYNFILNASNGGTEPHYRAPAPPDVATIPRYFELASGTWANSTAGGLFPVAGQNLSSRVNVGGAASLPHQSYYEFELTDNVLGIDTFGDYIFEHNGPAGSPNGHPVTKFKVHHTFGIPDDSTTFSTNLRGAVWDQIGGALKTFKLSPGGTITLTLTRDAGTDATAGSSTAYFLRDDLVRVRKIPTGALIGVNVAQGVLFNFGEVNFRDPAGPTGQLNKRSVTIGSRGESQLQVNNIRFRNGSRFSVVNMPPAFPVYLRAINGELIVNLAFTPNKIQAAYGDTLEVFSNSTRDSIILIPVTGNGVGGIFTFDDAVAADHGSHPIFGGTYFGSWDITSMNRWQVEVNAKPDSIAIGTSRRVLPMKYYKNGFFEWYPNLPAEVGASDTMFATVFATVGANMSKAAPIARYIVYSGGGLKTKDTLVNQNALVAGTRGAAEIGLGMHAFFRGGRDAFADTTNGAGPGIFGHVRVQADTAGVNFAGSDTLALVADAVILREQETPSVVVGVATESSIPTDFALDQNYPNPFNPSTTIRFALPIRATVEMKIFDLLGREVRTLIKGEQINPGTHNIVWDGRNSAGHTVATGVYFYRIDAAGFTQSKKMLLIK